MSIDKRISEFDIIEEFDITTKIPIIQGSPLKNGIITPKDFTKTIADDMLIELSLDNVDNTSDMNKPISTAQSTAIGLKADKTYVDNKVKTDVPANAKFTDTNTITSINGKTGVITKGDIVALWIPTKDTKTTINGKTGVISKSDIVALGIPAQDTVVDISGKADKTYVDNKVKTNVPVDAKFTDTIVDISGKADKTYVDNKVKTDVPAGAKFTDTIVDISGKADKTYVDEEIAILEARPLPDPMITLTEDEYHYLNPKDPNTYYFIKED